MVATIADALAHAHDSGVIHRDLNPQNILVDVSGQPRILDFGLAKFNDELATVTSASGVLGTPSYASPEQLAGQSHDVDGRTDLYSVGGIFYELLTGRCPFEGTLNTLLHRIQHEDPVDACEINPELPPELGRICALCLAKSPDHRYQSAVHLREDLQRFLGDQPLLYATEDKPSASARQVEDLAGSEGRDGSVRRLFRGRASLFLTAIAVVMAILAAIALLRG